MVRPAVQVRADPRSFWSGVWKALPMSYEVDFLALFSMLASFSVPTGGFKHRRALVRGRCACSNSSVPAGCELSHLDPVALVAPPWTPKPFWHRPVYSISVYL